ncbi:M23 family metallopeptidase [Caproiciproducens faecalis]|uniref:M23 family metallopeptidase n=1 Tax=Caproiciproducens faecalis TaxID=2820301 RepID=A0ABS7DQE2_9FIRM|nr:M23 family metallopeptidase [Caproiciproducens faecalis]MBW7573287.1 M23 family metallopeptidase [Caproiciproducens faecalis]
MKRKRLIAFILVLTAAAGIAAASGNYGEGVPAATQTESSASSSSGDYIKYVEFNVPYLAMKKAMNLDISSQKEEKKVSWIELLAYLAAKYGGNFSHYKSNDMDVLTTKLKTQTMAELTKNMKLYTYYYKAYSAVLGGLLGTYTDSTGETKYGLIGYSPIAKTFPYEDYDDFGASRTYGYKRQHLGHDMMAATGTPVIAVESGIVEALGWNQYGGWRIGIRSFDKQRYYYYAHLRQNRPYAADLAVGQTVTAGDVIGYVGHTGYSTKENVNNIKVSHLHFGMELIFDESQKESVNEIWVDVYQLCKLLRQNQSEVVRNNETKEYSRKNQIQIQYLQENSI